MMSALAIHIHPNQVGQAYSYIAIKVSCKQSDLQLQRLSEPRKPVTTVVLKNDRQTLRLLPDVVVCLGACV